MLEKFKFFKDKDKDKNKTKNKSSQQSSSRINSRSDILSGTSSSDTTTSSSYTSSSSSGDHVGSRLIDVVSTPIGITSSSSPKHSSKSAKKFMVRAFISTKDTVNDVSEDPPPIPSSVGLGPPSGGLHLSSHRHDDSLHTKSVHPSAKSEITELPHANIKCSTVWPKSTSSKKPSKLKHSSDVTKSHHSSPSKSGTATPSPYSLACSQLPSHTPTSGTTTPSPYSLACPLPPSTPPMSGIPRLASSKSSGKISKGDKHLVVASIHEPLATIPKLSSQHHHNRQHHHYIQQQQQQQQDFSLYQTQQHHHYSQLTHPLQKQGPLHQEHNHRTHVVDVYSTQRGYIQPYAENPGYASPSRAQAATVGHGIYSRGPIQNMDPRQKLDHQKHSHSSLNHHRVPHETSHHSSSSTAVQTSDNSPRLGRHVKQTLPKGLMTSPNLDRHNLSINIVKPTVSRATPNTTIIKASKSDSNTQTTLSLLPTASILKHINLGNDPTPKSESNPNEKPQSAPPSAFSVNKSLSGKLKTADPEASEKKPGIDSVVEKTKDDDTKEDHSTPLSNKQSSVDSKVGGLCNPELPDVEKEHLPYVMRSTNRHLDQSMGVKIASNIAVVPPHSGEKIEEAAIGSNVSDSAEALHSDSDTVRPFHSAETTSLQQEINGRTTFVDDTGEPMDIAPMAPIMRTLPYGYFGGFTGNREIPVAAIAMPCMKVPVGPDSRSFVVDPCSNPLYSEQVKGIYSMSCPNSGSSDQDYASEPDTYASESDTYDYLSGYMSDGDILKNKNNGVGGEEWTCGYLSEGGASLYATRLQQRFREGMQAVRECMRRSRAITDEDSFDDSSSISSGDNSDTLPETSTDDNLTASSLGTASDNPFICLKRDSNDSHHIPSKFSTSANTPVGALGFSSRLGKQGPFSDTSASMGAEYNSNSNFDPGSPWGRRNVVPQPSPVMNSDTSEYGWPSSRSDGGFTSMRKLSSASNPDYAYFSEGDYDPPRRSFSPGVGLTKDSETNTDQSHLSEVNLRRLQLDKSGNYIPPRMPFGQRRQFNGANVVSGMGQSSDLKGKCLTSLESRLTKYALDHGQSSTVDLIPRPASAMDRPLNPDVTLMDGFSSSSLDRKKANTGAKPNKATSCTQTDRDCHSLGRLRIFENKAKQSTTSGDQHGFNSPTMAGSVGSSPLGTPRKQPSHYVNLEELQARLAGSNYSPVDFATKSRNSVSDVPSGSIWIKSSLSSNGFGLPQSINSSHQFHALSDSETLDSLSNPQLQTQLQSRTLLNARLLAHHPEMHPIPMSASPPSSSSYSQCLKRQNSIKSENPYSNAKFCSLNEDSTSADSISQAHRSQLQTDQASMAFSQSSRFTFPASYGTSTDNAGSIIVRSSTQASLPYSAGGILSRRASRDDNESLRDSTLSLASGSSMFSSPDEKRAHEMRKLKRDLMAAQEKVLTLSSQLSTNAHVVSAFEQSLSSMTARLQSLTLNSESKDSELNELRMTIEALTRQSKMTLHDPVLSDPASRRHTTPGMRNITIASLESHFPRQRSSDSVSSSTSMSSACSRTSQQSSLTDSEVTKKAAKQAKKKGWLRTSFSKAFSRKKGKAMSPSEVEPAYYNLRSNVSAPNSPLLQFGHLESPSIKGSQSSGTLCDNDVHALKQALMDKDMKLTDIRLEALSSAHQLEQLRETMTKMKNEMSALKADNDRLHHLMSSPQSSRSLGLVHAPLSPRHAISSTDSLERSFSLTDHSSLEVLLAETAAIDHDGKRVTICVVLGSNPTLEIKSDVDKSTEVLIGCTSISGKTRWDNLDNAVGKSFKEYVLRLDPVTNLGLSAESISSYVIGEITRTKDSELPELLPIGYFVGDTSEIQICLKGTKQSCVDSFAFETMIPKSVVQRYVTLLLEHHRIVLCGPSGTGKTYLAQKLAEHVILRSGRDLTAGSVATFNIDHKTVHDLRQYLANLAEQCESADINALPSVIILDNLHHVASLADVFNGFMSSKYQKCLYIIGTMNQQSCSTTYLQLQHNFRFVLCANHMEVKSFLGRYLRRKLIESELRTGVRNNDLNRVIDWIPKVWAHLNKALEVHSQTDVTIGPRLFMSCPMDIAGSQVWFTDLWNYTLVESVREGLQTYGCQDPWEDPADWVLETYPWPNRGSGTSLMHIQADDLDFDQQTLTLNSPLSSLTKSPDNMSKDNDPLVSKIIRLQDSTGTCDTSKTYSAGNNQSDMMDTCSSKQDFSTNSAAVESRL